MSRFAPVALAVVVCFVTWTAGAGAVPAPDDGTVVRERWEYAELYTTRVLRAPPAGVGGAAQATTTIHWVAGGEEVEAPGWEDMAAKLNSAAATANASAAAHRLRVLNRLGAEGWEMVSHNKGTATTSPESWTFKRRVLK